MRRREFITLISGASLGWALAARAQQNGSPRVVALMAFKEDDPEEQLRVNALREGLQALGWRERTNIQIEWRFAAGDLSLMQRYASELVNLKPTGHPCREYACYGSGSPRDARNTHCICSSRRSGWKWVRCKPCTTWWQCYRLHKL